MIIEQIYTGCLAQGAYYIESNKEAVIIDPLREIKPYIEKAKQNNAKIKYVLETHFHADFVSGHIDLARETGATIVYGPTANPEFDAHIATDGEVLQVGDLTITILHTPGHTLESTCFLLADATGKNIALFTGDTLFIGDVGRPDLAQKISADLTQEILAQKLYHSLHTKIMPLADDIIIYPAHGAGSACGKNMSKETFDTLGNQKKVNYALQPMDEATFVEKVLDGLTPPPGYFPENVLLNSKGYENIDAVLQRGSKALKPEEFEQVANETNALILDTRNGQKFMEKFIPNSIFIGIDGGFAPWVGTLITDIKQPILLVADQDRVEEVITRLARVGYDNTLGYLQGGIAAWEAAGKETDTITSLSVAEVAARLENENDVALVDIRKPSEYEAEHVVDINNVPLDYINSNFNQLDKNKTYFIHCASGYRSIIFTSILRARGYQNLIDVQGGFKAIKASDLYKLSSFTCTNAI
ncbi:MBL fold metallo-hydrolase [Flavobacterium agricola]|uniref:MBL fold metallo-hydrolase n=1 Tax=Flavobacterium agricola TaxID=2870839 RepID=A0ABY6LX66_9FLAO|nr:MBL fold metallo-hydrolase [Flavobacterium agricola]UYW00809.1 MBL fold metallo-hydrolase [Flavobacterium agricola]